MDLKLSHFDLLETKRKHVRKYSEKNTRKKIKLKTLYGKPGKQLQVKNKRNGL